MTRRARTGSRVGGAFCLPGRTSLQEEGSDAKAIPPNSTDADCHAVGRCGSAGRSPVSGSGCLPVGAANTDPDCEVIPLQLPLCGFNPTIDDLGLDPADCNGNGWSDWIDIFITGDSRDDNTNGIPDECECLCGDIDSSGGAVNLQDFATFAGCFGLSPAVSQACLCSDMNGDDAINLNDFAIFANLFGLSSSNTRPDCP